MKCIVCKSVDTPGANEICELCGTRLADHFKEPTYSNIIEGCLRGGRAHLKVAHSAVQIAAARSELAALYFARPKAQRDTFLWRYNCRTAHPELHDIIGAVTALELIKWRDK